MLGRFETPLSQISIISSLAILKQAKVNSPSESRLIIRGDENSDLVASEEIWTRHALSHHGLIHVSQSTMLLEDLYKFVEGQSTRPFAIRSQFSFNIQV